MSLQVWQNRMKVSKEELYLGSTFHLKVSLSILYHPPSISLRMFSMHGKACESTFQFLYYMHRLYTSSFQNFKEHGEELFVSEKLSKGTGIWETQNVPVAESVVTTQTSTLFGTSFLNDF